jgi:hypothetical protein
VQTRADRARSLLGQTLNLLGREPRPLAAFRGKPIGNAISGRPIMSNGTGLVCRTASHA